MPYIDNSITFETPFPQGTCLVEYPFKRLNDRVSFLVTQQVVQPNSLYRPEAPGLTFEESRINADNVLLPEGISDAFLIEESDPTLIGNGLLAWNQVWGVIPQTRIDPVLASWIQPGISITGMANATITGYGFAARPVGLSVDAYVDVDDATGLAVGNVVAFTIFVPSSFSPGIFTQQVIRARVLEIATLRIFLDQVAGINYFFSSIFADKLTFSTLRNGIVRPAKAVSISGFEQVDYQILESADQYNPPQPFVVLNSVGEETDSITSTTTPTAAAYLSYIANGDALQSASVEMSRWRGNIYEIRTPFVRAQ